jgi:hypothetical protein
MNYTTLRLYASLYYVPDPALRPFHYVEGKETVMAFELDEKTGRNIEPDPARYLGSPLWTGRAVSVKEGSEPGGPGSTIPRGFSIPRGVYFFSQIRELPDKDGWTRFAIEVQKEGLWRRNVLGSRLYLRVVYEDGTVAAQIFRECL